MDAQALDTFVEQYNATHERDHELTFDAHPKSTLRIRVKGPKIEFTAQSQDPIVFFQLLSLRGYRKDERGNWTSQILQLRDSPMAVPELSRKMKDWGWDCQGGRYTPFYFHEQSRTGLPRPISKTSQLHQQTGFKWGTNVSDSPGTAFQQKPISFYPDWEFVVLHFRTFATKVYGLQDVSQLPVLKKADLTNVSYLPGHMVEWIAVPPWGKEGYRLWNQIFARLNTAFMGGIVYIVPAFDPQHPLEGVHQVVPEWLHPETRTEVFFEPLDFWETHFGK